MKLAAILAVALATTGIAHLPAAHADAVNIKKTKGDNQKVIAGPSFSPLELQVLDDKGVGIGGLAVTFTCTRIPSGPCITMPKSPFTTHSGKGGLAMLTPGDRPQVPKVYAPGVETIAVSVPGARAEFRVEFVDDTSN
jgi:hypothetical protein